MSVLRAMKRNDCGDVGGAYSLLLFPLCCPARQLRFICIPISEILHPKKCLYIEFCKRKKKGKIHSDLYRHYKYIFGSISDRFHFSFFLQLPAVPFGWEELRLYVGRTAVCALEQYNAGRIVQKTRQR